MKKKVLFLLLTIVCSFLLTNIVFANQLNPKDTFHNALKNTDEVLKDEINLIKEELYLNTIDKNLLSDFKAEIKTNISEWKFTKTEYTNEDDFEVHNIPVTLKDFFYNRQFFVHSENFSKLIKTDYKMPSFYDDDICDAEKFDVYECYDFLAAKNYNESENFYFLNQEAIDKYREDLIASEFTLDDEANIELFSSAIYGMASSLNQLEFMKNKTDATEEYMLSINKIINKYFERGTYSFAGKEIINTTYGDIPTEKYSFVLSNANIKEMLNELLKTYYVDYIGFDDYDLLSEEMNDLINIVGTEHLVYTIYVDKNNLVLRNEFKFKYSSADFDDKFNIKVLIDTTGEKQLLNDLEVRLEYMDSENVVTGFSLNLNGNVVPNNGIIDANLNLDLITSEDITNKPENTTFFKANLYKDKSTHKDNFSLTWGIFDDYFSSSTSFDIKGKLTLDPKKDKVDLIITNGNYYDNYNTISFNGNLFIEKLNEFSFILDEDSIDFLSLSEDESSKIGYMFYFLS